LSEGYNPEDAGRKFKDHAMMKIELREHLNAQQERHNAKNLPDAPTKKAEEVASSVNKSNEILRSIETNNKPLADFSRMILGGGPLGENGISAIQLGGMRGAHNRATKLIFEGIGMIVQTSMLDGLKSRP
jgi:hypothetical protein